ncbi:MAG: phosphatidylglycerol lysyltransferase [Treponema sp.]|nr:phosphatidylglycerol lysyltransferase [Treponema sp.]
MLTYWTPPKTEHPKVILLGTDTRPTGKAIADVMIPVLLAAGFDARYAGFIAAPEIMAWARSAAGAAGFIYISASHNPIGYNGIKFGLTDGGVLAADEAAKLIANFHSFIKRKDCLEKIRELSLREMTQAADSARLKKVYESETAAKVEARKAYYDFCSEVAWGDGSCQKKIFNHGDHGVLKCKRFQSFNQISILFSAKLRVLRGRTPTYLAPALKDSLAKKPLGIVCDFNGSARTVSVDRDFFAALGLKFKCINGEPGQIVHRIVPEGESLEPCRLLLEEAHRQDAAFMLGYVPDCDGDRGNLVVWDDAAGKARALEAQEVFALACLAELAHLVWTGELVYDENGKRLFEKRLSKVAVAINDPTSMRVDRIAEAFGVSVFRAEVGEANVVGLARKLRKEGYTVRILGEGSAGGNITHPSAVRDPLHTVLAIVKLLALRSCETKPGFEKPGFFKIWRKLTGQAYSDDFTLADIIGSLPRFFSTSAYSQDAVLQIKTMDHATLKNRYREVFLREWEKRKDELFSKYGFTGWEAIAYNGLEEKRGISCFGEAGKGGLKILFINEEAKELAYIWMRGSATEPVLRIMADVELTDKTNGQTERFLLDWQRQMIMEAIA